MNKILQIVFGVFWFLAGILILTQIWNWTTILSDLILDTFFLAIYWIGIFALILLTIVMPPFLLILDACKEED